MVVIVAVMVVMVRSRRNNGSGTRADAFLLMIRFDRRDIRGRGSFLD